MASSRKPHRCTVLPVVAPIWLRLTTLICLFAASLANPNMVDAACAQPQCVHLPFVARTEPVQILAVHYAFIGRSHYFSMVGTIINTAEFPVAKVTIRTTLLDTVHGETQTVENTTSLTATLPGQLNPFSVSGINFPVMTGISPTAVTIVSWTPLGEGQYKNPVIESMHLSITNPYPSTHVYGTLRNNTGSNLKDVRVVIWTTELAQMETLPPIARLEIGQSAPYSTFFNMDWRLWPSLNIVAQGVVVP